MRNQSGFTLIEMIAVITIIGILMATSVINMWKPSEGAVNKEARMTLKMIVSAEKAYFLESGMYVAGENETVINSLLRLDLSTSEGAKNWAYSVSVSESNDTFNATAVRQKGSGRNFYITDNMSEPAFF